MFYRGRNSIVELYIKYFERDFILMNKELPILNRTLTLRHLVFFGLAFMAPMVFFLTYGVVVQISEGMLPTGYAIAVIVMLFTAYSYGKMVKLYPVAGSSYTFVQKSINAHTGFLVGWAILMDYLFSPMIAALTVGIFVSSFLPFLPASIIILVFVAIISTINILGIKITVKFNTFSVALQILTIVLFIVLSIKGVVNGMGTGSLISSQPFFNPDVEFFNIFAAVPLLIFSFLGFDAVTTLSEETINPKENLPKAIFLIAIIAGIVFITVSYFAQIVYPDYHSFTHPDSAAMEIATFIGGNLFTSIFLAVLIIANFSAAVAHSASGSRVLYAMGRENVLPKKVFGYISPKFNTPIYNILLIALFCLIALFIDLATATSFVSYGALLAFTFVNLSVIFHYFIREKNRSIKGIISYLIVPLIGASLTAFMWLKLDIHSLLLGTGWVVLGIIYLLYLTKGFSQPPPVLIFEETISEHQ